MCVLCKGARWERGMEMYKTVRREALLGEGSQRLAAVDTPVPWDTPLGRRG